MRARSVNENIQSVFVPKDEETIEIDFQVKYGVSYKDLQGLVEDLNKHGVEAKLHPADDYALIYVMGWDVYSGTVARHTLGRCISEKHANRVKTALEKNMDTFWKESDVNQYSVEKSSWSFYLNYKQAKDLLKYLETHEG